MGRRLAAILAADVVGYAKLMAEDEAGTLAALKAHRRALFDPETARHGGRIVKLMGDGALVEFPSVVDAVACALAIQQALAAGEGKIRLRIGINLGDVIIDGDDIYGDGVNVAARLEALAEPGGIAISGMVNEGLGNRVEADFADAGEHQVKNIARPIRVWRWSPAPNQTPHVEAKPVSEKPSIAVLPFDNMSGDPDQEYFSDGIAEDIITALSHFREFFVIARNTTFTYKGKAVKVDQVCRELGVRYLLEGSVRKAGNRVRVTAQLIDGETGAHLWASRFDRDLDDIFAVQDEITQSIVTAVAPETLGAELKRSQFKRAEDLSAWEKVMRARWHINRLTKEDNDIARRLLAEAVAAEPGLAEAYSTLALCYLNDMLHVWCSDAAEAVAAGEAAARQAVALNGNDANALAVRGILLTFGRHHVEALGHFRRAIALNPNLAMAHGLMAATLGVRGEYDAACAALARALALSPRDSSRPMWYAGKGIAAYVTERYEDCVANAREALREDPGYASLLRQLTAALGMLGRREEAAEALRLLLERMPGLTISRVRPIVPIADPSAQERWLEGLRRAGLPE
jgi:TolB-like protein